MHTAMCIDPIVKIILGGRQGVQNGRGGGGAGQVVEAYLSQ